MRTTINDLNAKKTNETKNWTTEKHLPIAGYRWASDKIKCSKCYIRLNLHMVRKLLSYI